MELLATVPVGLPVCCHESVSVPPLSFALGRQLQCCFGEVPGLESEAFIRISGNRVCVAEVMQRRESQYGGIEI